MQKHFSAENWGVLQSDCHWEKRSPVVFCIVLWWPESLAERTAVTGYCVMKCVSSVVHDTVEFLQHPSLSHFWPHTQYGSSFSHQFVDPIGIRCADLTAPAHQCVEDHSDHHWVLEHIALQTLKHHGFLASEVIVYSDLFFLPSLSSLLSPVYCPDTLPDTCTKMPST